jgi:hypothetical protein
MQTIPPSSPPSPPASADPVDANRALLLLTSLALLGAAVIHFAVTPVHLTESASHGSFFLAIAWLQLGLAGALWFGRRAQRPLLVVTIVLNTFIAAVWLVSRTSDLPFDLADKEPVGFPDVLASVLGMVAVAGAAVLLTGALERRKLAPQAAGVLFGVSTIAVLALVTASMTPALGGSHHHGDEGGEEGTEAAHPHGGGGNGTAAGGHDHSGGEATQVTAATGDGGGSSNGHSAGGGHGDHEYTVEEMKAFGLTDDQIAGLKETNFHGPPPPNDPIDPRTRAGLAAQLQATQDMALKYPTVADAEEAGFKMATPFVPLIGAHYLNIGELTGNGFRPEMPEMLLYDGTKPDSKLQGVAFFVFSEDKPPEGFFGPNDRWHQHVGLCLKGARVVGGEKLTEEECEERGGEKTSLDDAWLVHAWVVPGWESPWGVFSAEHPDIGKA